MTLGGKKMRITRFSSSSDGRSHFSEIEIEYPLEFSAAGGYDVEASNALESPSVQFIVLPAELDQDLHPVPSRQLVVVLDGQLDVGTPDGETRRFARGDMFLADDADTDGHDTSGRRAGSPPIRADS